MSCAPSNSYQGIKVELTRKLFSALWIKDDFDMTLKDHTAQYIIWYIPH